MLLINCLLRFESVSQDQIKNYSDEYFSIKNTTIVHKSVNRMEKISLKPDRYGWETTENESELSPEELLARKIESETEKMRESKWIEMLRNWDVYSTKKYSKLKERVRKGIPDAMRSKVWQLLIDPPSQEINSRVSLDSLISKGRQKCCDVIEADLGRTNPHCLMFKNPKTIESLRRVLYAYSNYDPELGYTQGMSFIASLLLQYMDEDQAYYCLQSLMQNTRYHLRMFYISGFPKLMDASKIWDVALKLKYPKVSENFEKQGILSLVYIPSWFLTMFLNIDFPIHVRLRIFDRYAIYGFRALLSFGMVIISRLKNILSVSKTDVILMAFQKPSESTEFDDWRYLLKKYDDLWIGQLVYKKILEESGIEGFE